MKILYAIQGTGNGHLARATEIVPLLKTMVETDVLVSGIQGDLQLPFDVKYKYYGLSFIFGKKGGVSFLKTFLKLKPFRFIKDVYKLPLDNYDLVLCDFEPVTAWACKLRGKKAAGVSHQNAVLHSNAPKPQKADWLGNTILKKYAPSTKKYGFHFQKLDENNFTPVIRSAIRKAKEKKLSHYTVYLPAYSDDEIITALSPFNEVRWEVFSKHSAKTYEQGNVRIRPVSLEHFTQSFTTCTGILCAAGFETPAEAIFMGKKLCVIPMKKQYEQACNAAFLGEMGVIVLAELKNQTKKIDEWINQSDSLQINYPDNTLEVLAQILHSA